MKKVVSIIMLFLSVTACGQIAKNKNLTSFIPEGYKLFKKIEGDLNQDGIKDCALIIKGTSKKYFYKDEFRGELDRNRRGLIVLINKNGKYELLVKNISCFSSENEDGGVYFPPELSIEIEKNKLFILYSHGRYGYMKYTFRASNSDMELIGFDQGDASSFISDYVTFDEISINFLNGKKLEKKVIGVSEKSGEVYKKTLKRVSIGNRLKLSAIKDFDELDMSQY